MDITFSRLGLISLRPSLQQPPTRTPLDTFMAELNPPPYDESQAEKPSKHQPSIGGNVTSEKLSYVDPTSTTLEAGFDSRQRDFVQNIEDTLHRTQDIQKKFKDVYQFTRLLDRAELKSRNGTPWEATRPKWERIDKVSPHLYIYLLLTRYVYLQNYQKYLQESVDIARKGKVAGRGASPYCLYYLIHSELIMISSIF
jgi:hypothetical protein